MAKKKINFLSTLSALSFIVIFAGVAMLFIGFAYSFIQIHDQQLSREITGDDTAAIGNGLKLLGAGFTSIGFVGSGIGQGYAAGKAAEGVSRNPEAETKIRNMLIVGAAIAETSALYALVIGILLIFVA